MVCANPPHWIGFPSLGSVQMCEPKCGQSRLPGASWQVHGRISEEKRSQPCAHCRCRHYSHDHFHFRGFSCETLNGDLMRPGHPSAGVRSQVPWFPGLVPSPIACLLAGVRCCSLLSQSSRLSLGPCHLLRSQDLIMPN